ncbi:MAG: hypothetical protein P8Y93_11130, partial [Acidobacteriota bacterium]
RSMGFDTECGLGIDGSEREDIRAALCDLRIRLISEHLDVTPAIFESKERELGMLAAVDALRGAGRTLKILETEEEEVAGIMEPVARVADPKKPIRVADLIDDFF